MKKAILKVFCEECGAEWPITEVEIVDIDQIPNGEVVIFTCPGCLKQSGNAVPVGVI